MAAEDNANWLSGLTNALYNAGSWMAVDPETERQEVIRSTVDRITDEEGVVKRDARGMPDVGLGGWWAGLKGGLADQKDLNEQVLGNNVALENQKRLTEYPSLASVTVERNEGDNDLTYGNRLKAAQQSKLALTDAIEAGVPRDRFESGRQYTPGQVAEIKKRYEANQSTIGLIEQEQFGPELLAARRELNEGKPLNKAQLAGVLQKARAKDPGRVSRLETERVTREATERNANSTALTAETDAVTARNNARIQQAEIEFKNRQLQYDYDVANIRERNRLKEANLDRTLRKDLAILGLEDKREDRRFDAARDERQQRQMMILQLMKGLSSLGQNIAI